MMGKKQRPVTDGSHEKIEVKDGLRRGDKLKSCQGKKRGAL